MRNGWRRRVRQQGRLARRTNRLRLRNQLDFRAVAFVAAVDLAVGSSSRGYRQLLVVSVSASSEPVLNLVLASIESLSAAQHRPRRHRR
jgi:hypothetical protein